MSNGTKLITRDLTIIIVIFAILLGIPYWVASGRDAEAAALSKYSEQYYDATVGSMSGETHVYYFGGVTPTVPYARFYNRVTQELYNSATETMGAKATTAWGDTEVLLTDETATVGGWLYDMPDVGKIPNGWYDVMVYERVGAAPVAADTLYYGRLCFIAKGVIVSFDNR